ncbi:unnamed protein product [Ilex paraguariensis]|uniref:RING-type E3 ubiquitin transferase n=1 Tax=Ilex paraguariensis TaxID=185542 RepID=A0ABC8TW19_9AQUA
MPTLPWLPPLSSHENYRIEASAWQYHMLLDRPNLPLPMFLIKFNVNVDFYSQDTSVERSFPGLSTSKTFHVVGNSRLFREDSMSRNRICNMIREVPFPLRRVHWKATQLDGNSSNTLLEDEDGLIETLLEFLCSMMTQPCNTRRKLFPLELVIKKTVKIPHHEFEAWTSWYDEQKSLNDDFERDYLTAISELRPFDEHGIISPVSRPSMAALEVVQVNNSNDPAELCSICLEKFLIETKVSRMPCSHIFHAECIVSGGACGMTSFKADDNEDEIT